MYTQKVIPAVKSLKKAYQENPSQVKAIVDNEPTFVSRSLFNRTAKY